MTSHAEARALATTALTKRFGGTPTAGEVKALAGVGYLESGYGDWWKEGAGKGSHNIGAIGADPSWTGEFFEHKDSTPQSDGTSTWEIRKFRVYPTAEAGWYDLADTLYVRLGNKGAVRAAAQRNDWAGVSAAMYAAGYYQGFGKTAEERIAGHVKALTSSIALADGAKPARPKPDQTVSIAVRVQNPQGDSIGTASISEAVAPGCTALATVYGAPIMVAYPNGWRFLKFAPDVQIPALNGLAFAPLEQNAPLSFGWQSGVAIGILGIVTTIFVGTLQPAARRFFS